MPLLDYIRMAVRVSPVPVADELGNEPDTDGWTPTFTSDFDEELQGLADAACSELSRAGVDPALLESLDAPKDWGDKLARHAVVLYVKAHFGYDNDEADRFLAGFMRAEVDLLNSSANIAQVGDAPAAGGGE